MPLEEVVKSLAMQPTQKQLKNLSGPGVKKITLKHETTEFTARKGQPTVKSTVEANKNRREVSIFFKLQAIVCTDVIQLC